MQKIKSRLLAWIDSYQYLALLYFLAKIHSLGFISEIKSSKISIISKKIGLENEILIRIFLALESINILKIKNKEILLTKDGKFFLNKDKNLALKAIISFERWLPHFQTISELINQPEHKKFNKKYTRFIMNKTQESLRAWLSKETEGQARYILPKLPLKNVTSIADIGGGDGILLIELLKLNKKITGKIYDSIYFKNNILTSYGNQKTEKRISRIGCNFFKKIKLSSQVVLLKSVLHNWSDLDAVKILKNINRSMPENSKLYIIERIIDNNKICGSKSDIFFLDLKMMFVHDGKERTLSEFKEMLNLSNFALEKKIKTDNGFFILIASKAKQSTFFKKVI